MSYDANDALNEIEEALSELERVAEDLINNNPNKESELRGQGVHQGGCAGIRFFGGLFIFRF